jgi:hypothetical protein
MTFHTEIEKLNPEIHIEVQKTPNIQSNPEIRNTNTKGIIVLDFKIYYRAIVTKQDSNGIRICM